MSRNEQSGQALVLASLMMVVFLAIAAFAVNAAYAFNQHSRMQSDLDNAVKYAADGGDATSYLGSLGYDTAGVTIQSPPASGIHAGDVGYVAGYLTESPKSLFGSTLRFPFKVSVHAEAVHGGYSRTPAALLALSSSSCAILFNGSTGTQTNVTGAIESNSSEPNAGGSSCWNGNPPTDLNGDRTQTCDAAAQCTASESPALTDPYAIPVPSSSTVTSTGTKCTTVGGCHTTCSYTIPQSSGGTGYYYFEPQDTSGIVEVTALPNGLGSNDTLIFLPYCSGGTAYPGVYLFDVPLSGLGGFLFSYDSVFVMQPNQSVTINSTTYALLNAPIASGTTTFPLGTYAPPAYNPFAGYALYQSAALPCSSATPTPAGYQSPVAVKINGADNSIINGLIDFACGNVNVQGGAHQKVNGPVVGYTVQVGGSGTDTVNNLGDSNPPPRGSILDQ